MTAAAPTLQTAMPSPLGPILLTGDGEALTGVRFAGPADAPAGATAPGAGGEGGVVGEAQRQLAEYLDGRRTDFELPLHPAGTPFQQAVWEALRAIPYGETTSYGALAVRLDRPGAARAVGLANARNPLAIVVPCHRAIGAAGALTGYAAGLERKRRLLELEAGALTLETGAGEQGPASNR